MTASGSGLDPQIGPAAAEPRGHRVAKACGLNEDQVRAMLDSLARRRWAGLFGEPGVNVLLLNLALDQQNNRR